MTGTVNELFVDALNFDQFLLAYAIIWSIKHGLCQAHDDVSSFKEELVNFEEAQRMMEQNELGIVPIKLYSVETEPGYHLLVLAENEQSARGAYLNEIGTLPKSIEDVSLQMDRTYWNEDMGNKRVRVLKDNTIMFPAILFEYEKNKLEK